MKEFCAYMFLAVTVLQLFCWDPWPLPERASGAAPMQLQAELLVPAAGSGYLLPRAAHDPNQLIKARLGEANVPQKLFGLGAAIRALHIEAVHSYGLDNDLHFNSPPIIYRQSSSEHSTEG